MRVPPHLKRALFWLRLAVPVALLAIIFSKVDVRRLLSTLSSVNGPMACYSLLVGYIAPILFCAWRWQVVLRAFYGVRVPYRLLLSRFWTGLFVGYVIPGGVGSDIYRVASMRTEAGGFRLHAAAVVGEKILIILANGILLLVSYPLIADRMAAGPQAARVMQGAYALGAGALALLALIALLNTAWGARLRRAVQRLLGSTVSTVAAKALQADPGARAEAPADVITPFFRWRSQLLVLALSIAGQVLVSFGGRLLLLSVGIDLPLSVHIFVWTLVFFVFFLPISVGNFGVREASFIVFLGLFGVSREAALASSVVSLASVLATVAVGGLVYLGHSLDRRRG